MVHTPRTHISEQTLSQGWSVTPETTFCRTCHISEQTLFQGWSVSPETTFCRRLASKGSRASSRVCVGPLKRAGPASAPGVGGALRLRFAPAHRVSALLRCRAAIGLTSHACVRHVALYWHERAGVTGCSPGGTWAARDRLAFEADWE